MRHLAIVVKMEGVARTPSTGTCLAYACCDLVVGESGFGVDEHARETYRELTPFSEEIGP
jgi:hypothetical protein